MEVVVDQEEEAAEQQAQLDDSLNNKMFVPVSWANAYGKHYGLDAYLFSFFLA